MNTFQRQTSRIQRKDVDRTCFGLHGEVGLPLQDGVDELGVVSQRGVVGVRGRHPGHRGPCWEGGVRVIRCGSYSRGGKAITPRGVGGLEDWGVQDLPQRFLFRATLR